MDESWNSMYNYYKRQLIEVRKKRRLMRLRRLMGSKPKPTKSQKDIKEERQKRIAEWCASRAQPKRVFLPKPPRRRKIADLEKIQYRMFMLSQPRIVTNKYIRPSQDKLYIDPSRVRPSAKTYVATERITELAQNPEFKLIQEKIKIPGAVKRSALTCKVSPRFAELAEPKKKAAEKDSDLKENPFEISRNALKYRATERIQELAKPIER